MFEFFQHYLTLITPGLCDFNLNNFDNSKKKLEDIIFNYPSWPQLDEVNYWLVRLLLEKNEYESSF